MIKHSEPIFAVRDVKEAIAFYRDVLGGRGEWYWGEPVTFGGIRLDGVHLMFHQQPAIAAHVEGHQHHFFADAIDGLHSTHVAAGAPIVSPIENKPWGIREYTVRDLNGYHLRFSGPVRHDKPETSLETMPTHIRIDRRLPSTEEYVALARSVGWTPPKEPGSFLARCCWGVVAVDARDGSAVGMLRVVNDAHAWYSIWDVIVRPEHQEQRIGSAMIETALDHLRRESPGAIVYLFTYQHKFYEKLGFKNESCTMMRL